MDKITEIESHLESNQYVWLITGVAGFIGSNLLEYLLKKKQKVFGLDNFETGHIKNLIEVESSVDSSLWKNFSFLEGDIRNIETCIDSSIGVDFILHQAALGSVPRSIADPVRTNSTNINGFLNMLVAAKDAKVKKFVYAASSSTYGDHPDLPKKEKIIGNPLSPYAVTKVVNELYARVFRQTFSVEAVGLRYFNVFGKRQDPNGAYAAVIPKWISSLIKGEEVLINGDGSTSRDFCFIENAVQANILAAFSTKDSLDSMVFNVAYGQKTSLNELYEMLNSKLASRLRGNARKSPLYVDFREGDVKHSLADISQSRKILGYKPIFNLDKGLDIALKWYLDESHKND